jgi:broad specificity phosphatase PhoE
VSGVRRHTVCWLIRHGQTAWNREQRYLSRTNLPLTELGMRQAQATGRRLARQPLTTIIHSGLRQAEETAWWIAQGRTRQPLLEVQPDWREGDYGIWEGLTYQELMRYHAAEAHARFAEPWYVAPSGGETLAATQRRVLTAWQELLRHHDGERIAIVSHALPIQLLLCNLMGIDATGYWRLRIDLGSLSCVDLYPTAAIMRMINEAPRLPRPAE